MTCDESMVVVGGPDRVLASRNLVVDEAESAGRTEGASVLYIGLQWDKHKH